MTGLNYGPALHADRHCAPGREASTYGRSVETTHSGATAGNREMHPAGEDIVTPGLAVGVNRAHILVIGSHFARVVHTVQEELT